MAEINQSPSYREAMAELQKIVTRLRNTENVDVDDLVKDVARAKYLIDFCGEKIKRADAEIKTIVGDLPPPASE
jgi:exodeoxyribonuclease VII small subunit